MRDGGRRKGKVKKGEGIGRWYRPALVVNHTCSPGVHSGVWL